MSVSSVPQEIKPGDRVRVNCSGATREGVVKTAYAERSYDRETRTWHVDGWMLEFTDATYGPVYWKQLVDGGSVTVL